MAKCSAKKKKKCWVLMTFLSVVKPQRFRLWEVPQRVWKSQPFRALWCRPKSKHIGRHHFHIHWWCDHSSRESVCIFRVSSWALKPPQWPINLLCDYTESNIFCTSTRNSNFGPGLGNVQRGLLAIPQTSQMTHVDILTLSMWQE